MSPSRERLLRPLLAFLTLVLAAVLLAPTVASVHDKISAMHIQRDLPWQIWKWTDEPSPLTPNPDCSKKERHLEVNITQWPGRINKDQAFTLRGHVGSVEDGNDGVAGIKVKLYINATKTAPGAFLVDTQTGSGGFFTAIATVPFDASAQHYHLLANANETRKDCDIYHGAWSDPETDVTSNTTLQWDPIDHAVVGEDLAVSGRVLDAVGAPVVHVNVSVSYLSNRSTLTTGPDGRFTVHFTPATPGNFSFQATFAGNTYYAGSRNTTLVDVASEDVVFDEASGLALTRGTPTTIHGQVFVTPNVRGPDLTIRFNGTRIQTCPTCALTGSLAVHPDANGTFEATILVPSSEAPGDATFTLSGAGLRQTYAYNASVVVPTTLTLAAHGTSLFGHGFHVDAKLTDEAGRPMNATLSFSSPAGARNATLAAGAAAFDASGACGRASVHSAFAGADHVLPSSADAPMLVCGWMALVPPWILAIPWWLPLLVLALAAGGIWLARELRQKFASEILSGPPLALAFTEPDDDARGYAGLGERVAMTATLEGPLPDGHALRMGTPRAMEVVPLDGGLRARFLLTPDRLGEIALRAEIVDEKKRVVTRRTIVLRVVRYAEEIERRYLALRRSSGATDAITPREFERWLHEQAPGLDPTTARRLIHLFEEADYSPRTATRADFAAFLGAEQGLQEVSPDAAHP